MKVRSRMLLFSDQYSCRQKHVIMEINSFRYQTVFNIEVYKSLEGGHSFLIGTEIIGDDESFENLSLPT